MHAFDGKNAVGGVLRCALLSVTIALAGIPFFYVSASGAVSMPTTDTITESKAMAAQTTEQAPPTGVDRPAVSDLSPGATEEWWVTAQGRIREDMLVLGSTVTDLPPYPNWTVTGENDGDRLGFSVATAGDVNGDDYADVIVGAYRYTNESDRGKAYLYLGSSTGLNLSPVWTATGEHDGDRFGVSVASAGDVNGDGYADVIVGAYGYPSGDERGKAYVYHGSLTGPSLVPDWTASGENDGDRFGYSVATAGSVNGDGYDDVIVGAYGYLSGDARGKAYVYDGASTGLSPTPSWSAMGENGGDLFGYSVATAGNMNGDPYDDVIVGAYGYPSGNEQGKAYVYHGSLTGPSLVPDWTATGESEGDRFGISVATAGSVNGDGYDDVIVGANRYDDGGTGNPGKAYVYHGDAMGLSLIPDWTAIGENSGDRFGRPVASAGDVDGDGYADIIVGAAVYSNFLGKTYVFEGSSTGLSLVPGWIATGESDGDRFGRSAAMAGDVNGDGSTDVIVGAFHYHSPDYRGKAYVFHGVPCAYGVVVVPPNDAQSSDPGEAVTYTLYVINTGNCVDTYTVTVDAAWPVDALGTVGPLAPSTASELIVVAGIPLDAQCGDWDAAMVTVTSHGADVISATSILTTTANAVFGVAVTPQGDARFGEPGTTVTYTLGLSNTGNCADTFAITLTGNLWPTDAPAMVDPLEAGMGDDIEVSVHVPSGAKDGDSDVATVTCTSLGDGGVSTGSVLTTTAELSVWEIYLPVVLRGYGP